MSKRIRMATAVLSTCVAQFVHAQATPKPPAADTTAAPALAERFAELGQRTLRQGKTITPAQWDQSVALFQAATKLAPKELRFARLLTEAAQGAQDTDTLIEALKGWRRIDPNDRLPQIRFITLQASRMETAEGRLNYLSDLAGRAGVAEQVRAHAALAASRLAGERGESARAQQLLDLSLRLDPGNVEALQLNAMNFANGTVHERAAALWALLRANPAQPDTIASLADLYAGAGMSGEAVEGYGIALRMSARAGFAPDPDTVHALVAQLIRTNDLAGADNLTLQMLSIPGASNDPDLWFLRLLVDKSSGDKVKYDNARRVVLNVLFNRFQEARAQTGNPGATTRPLDSTGAPDLPDLADEAKALASKADPGTKASYVRAATDLAMFQIYFDRDAKSAEPLLDAIRILSGETDTTYTRLVGWAFSVDGKIDEARVKFSAVAERDPLGALGLFLLDDKDPLQPLPAPLEVRARQLLTRHPTGLVGATLSDALRSRNVKPDTTPDAAVLRESLTRFPRDLLNAPLEPERFYFVRGEPLKTSHAFGEPMLVKVSVTNTSIHPLTIGPAGLIKPDLWFDAQWRGIAQQQFPGVAVDRISGTGTLQPRQSVSFVMRLDQGQLADAMRGNPQVALQVSGTILSNPTGGGDGSVLPGLGGYRVQFSRLLERRAYPMSTEEARTQARNAINTGTVGERLGAMELLRSYVNLLARPDAEEATREIARGFAGALLTVAKDPEPTLRAWGNFLTLDLAADKTEATARLKEMMTDPDWQVRLLGLVGSGAIEPAERKALVAPLGTDAEPETVVRNYARAVVRSIDEQPAAVDAQVAPGNGQAVPADTQPVPADAQAAPADAQPAPADTQPAPADGGVAK